MRLYQKSLIPISGVIYGQTIYWLTFLSTSLVLIGTVVSFLEKDSPIPAAQLLQSVIDGKRVDQIWEGIGLSESPDMFYFVQKKIQFLIHLSFLRFLIQIVQFVSIFL